MPCSEYAVKGINYPFTEQLQMFSSMTTDIKQYEAGQNHSFQVSKANADALMHANDAKLRAAEIGLATSAQQVASAWSMVSASAQIDAGSRWNENTNISYNYSGDVSGDVSPKTHT